MMDVADASRLTRAPGEIGRKATRPSRQNHKRFPTPPASQPSSAQESKRVANGTLPKNGNYSSRRLSTDIEKSWSSRSRFNEQK